MSAMLDWLDSPAPASADTAAPSTVDGDWLEVTRIGTPYDGVRFSCMQGSGRVWACDGEYVACRPSGFHDATRRRHDGFLRSGNYRHVGTFDDVQVFELLPGSPFRRDNRTLIPGMNLYEDMREAAKAACSRDWVLYHDILEAMASSVKARFHDGQAKVVFEDILAQIEQSIRLRGGPTQAECDAGIGDVRRRRGVGRGRAIALPSARAR